MTAVKKEKREWVKRISLLWKKFVFGWKKQCMNVSHIRSEWLSATHPGNMFYPCQRKITFRVATLCTRHLTLNTEQLGEEYWNHLFLNTHGQWFVSKYWNTLNSSRNVIPNGLYSDHHQQPKNAPCLSVLSDAYCIVSNSPVIHTCVYFVYISVQMHISPV